MTDVQRHALRRMAGHPNGIVSPLVVMPSVVPYKRMEAMAALIKAGYVEKRGKTVVHERTGCVYGYSNEAYHLTPAGKEWVKMNSDGK